MSGPNPPEGTSRARARRQPPGASIACSIQRAGRILALVGVILPLLLIGGLKFTPLEVEALRPLIGGTPWLAWLYAVFGEAGPTGCRAAACPSCSSTVIPGA